MTAQEISIATIAKFAKKHGLPQYLVRTMCKRGELPGFFAGTRYYINEQRALETLETMSAASVRVQSGGEIDVR